MPKLHIPGPVALQATSCGRQLNNHRGLKAQDAANAAIAQSLDQYLEALAKGQACRFCGFASGIIAKPARAIADGEGEDSNWVDDE